MKKFWVGALSIFVLLGGIFFTACDKNKVSLSLSETYKEICINENLEDKTELVTAVVNGTDKGLVSVSSSFENIARASVEYNSATGKNEITLTGVSEGSAEIIVRSLYQSSVNEVINVYVYSDVLGMEPKTEDIESGKSNLYAVKNGQVTLSSQKLLNFTNGTRPTVNRKDILWSLPEGTQGATIEGNLLSVESDFAGNGGADGKILINATAKDNPSATTPVELNLIDAISKQDIKLSYTYTSSAGNYDELLENGAISVTPNIPTDDNYKAFIKLTFKGDKALSVEPQIKVNDTNSDQIIKIEKIGGPQIGTDTISYIYQIMAANDKVNGDCIVNFDISYKDFAYKVASSSFKVKCYEKINKVSVTNEQGTEVDGETSQAIYTNYKNIFGKLFNINLLPQSVIGATNEFNISIKYPLNYSNGTNINGDVDENTIQAYYPTGNSFKQFAFKRVSGGSNVMFTTEGFSLPANVKKIYIKANDGQILTQILNVEVTITPVENTNVSKTIKLDLFKSATALNFADDENANAVIPTSTNSPNVIEKEFTLEGQTTIAGLKTQFSSGKGFKVSSPIFVSNTSTSVTFKVQITVTDKGSTNTGWFKLTHDNGIESKQYSVELFLPVEDGIVSIKNYEEVSQSVTDFSMSGSKLYQLKNGALTEVVNNKSSLSNIMLKNGVSIPLSISTNFLNSSFAVARNEFSYFDYAGVTDEDFENWLKLSANDIVNGAKNLSEYVNIFNSTMTSTSKPGFTYAVAKFIGYDENHEETTFIRIIKVEVHVPVKNVKAENNNVSVYALNSVNDATETRAEIKVTFGDMPVTHIAGPDGSYFKFTSAKLGQFDLSRGEWSNSPANEYYTINNVRFFDTYLLFEVVGKTTSGQPIIDDSLVVSYTFHNINMSDKVNVRIKNADRLESVVWENYDKNGVYFETNASTTQSSVLVLSARDRQLAKNTNLFYYVTDQTGNATQAVKVENLNNNGLITVKATTGMTGYIYVLPEDAINSGAISYYYTSAGQEFNASLLVSELPSRFDFLYENAYFKNNKEQIILFKNILVKIQFTIADGRAWETAYRLYNESDFQGIEPTSYYTVMNSVELNGWNSIEFAGGIQGLDDTVSILLNGKSFIGRNEGTIRNLKFFGNVYGNGFVANVNEGTISNVTVDVNNSGAKVRPSSVIGEGFVGGLVGENAGTGKIENVNILGMQILSQTVTTDGTRAAGTNYAAGIAGKNSGKIERAKVELYKFENEIVDGVEQSVQSFIKGDFAAGIVGIMEGGTLKLSYIYDYSLSKLGATADATIGESKITGITGGAAGIYSFTGGTASENFAVVNNKDFYKNHNGGATEDYYSSYYLKNGEGAFVYTSYANKSNNDNWVSVDSAVNGGREYLKNIQQDKQLNSLNASVNTLKDSRNYYHALAVNKQKAIMMFYDVNLQGELSESAKNVLAGFNTVNLLDVIDGYNRAMAISSSDSKVAKVIGSQLVLTGKGNFELKIYSRFNYSMSQTISIEVISALSSVTANQNLNDKFVAIENGSIVSLQLGKSMTISYDMQYPYIYLGSEYYPLVRDGYVFKNFTSIESDANKPILSGNNILSIQTKATTTKESKVTSYIDYSKVLSDSELASSIENEFKSYFDLSLFEGAIKLNLTNDELIITPSETGLISAELLTNSEDDKLAVKIFYGDRLLTSDSSGVYSLDGQQRIVVTSNETNKTLGTTNAYTKKFDLTFEVASSYRGLIDSEQNYKIVVSSNREVTASEFTLKITKQSFTNVSMTSYLASGSFEGGEQRYIKNKLTSVISPGNTSLIDVLVSPEFAYYDHATFTVSNSPSANAVIVNYMQSAGSQDSPYYIDASSSVSGDGNGILLTSSDIKGSKSRLAFKIWLNPNVIENANLKFTINFFDAQGRPIEGSKANHFMSINYLSVPEVKVDGASETIVPKGTTSKVEIIVDHDQAVDISSATLVNVTGGIFLSSNWVESVNSQGRKVFSSTINTSVNATLSEGANEFYVKVLVSRILNGVLETKEAKATVKLIDFKVDTENIEVGSENVFTTYIGLSQTLNIKYPLLPESYNYDSSDKVSADNVATLKEKREKFLTQGYYPDTDNNYYINSYPSLGSEPNNILIRDRLYFWSEESKGWSPIFNSQTGTYYNIGGHLQFNFDENGNAISLTGTALTTSNLRFRLITYTGTTASVNPDDLAKKDTFFEVKVDAYSSEELPLCIRTEEDFYKMATGSQQDYILLNDIVLNNYTPFSTSSIRSLDGNGYTVYINSFNILPKNTNTLNLALFDKVNASTTLKNIRVNIYSGGQINVDVSTYKNINVAGFAISNDGIITNCEVVSFYDNKCSSTLSGGQGIQLKYLNGYNTTENQIYNDFSDWTSKIAGFVIDNAGNITNSRVGGESFYKITGASSPATPDLMEGERQNLDLFNITGQGDIAGFVLNNTGAISAAFVDRLAMFNESNSTKKFAAGFVGTNSGRVISSYIEGENNNSETGDNFCKQGSMLKSTASVVAGFVYTNNSVIKDCYSNILISNISSTTGENYIYLASGFVYTNNAEGDIENCFSASQVTSYKYSQMNFTGLSENGKLRNYASGYVNSYYYASSYLGDATSSEDTFETGAIRLIDVGNKNFFYGFAFSSNESTLDGVWTLSPVTGVSLVSANNIAISNRYYLAEQTGQEYKLPYAKIKTKEGTIDTSYGKSANPIIIRSAQEFAEVTGTSNVTAIKANFTATSINGNYRLVNDIDLASLASESQDVELPSAKKSFTGTFFGNGFTINNLSISAKETTLAYGLFGSIEKAKNSKIGASVVDINLKVNRVVNGQAMILGALAGLVKDSSIVNIDLTFSETCQVEGRNLVGGLIGFAYGNSRITDINVHGGNVYADRKISGSGEEGVLTTTSAYALRNAINNIKGDVLAGGITPVMVTQMQKELDILSYAGTVVGFIDNYTNSNAGTNTYTYVESRTNEEYNVSKVRVDGSIKVQAQVAGGLFGYIGNTTHVKDTGITIASGDANVNIYATKYYAGGIVGQLNGELKQSFSEYDKDTQTKIDNSINSYYNKSGNAENGNINIFACTSEDSTIAVGGLAGLVNNGSITQSYSLLNVINPRSSYAGGIAGKVDNLSASAYSFSDGLSSIVTKLLINEVYATGDVRGKEASGGILGLTAAGSQIHFMSVNAFNKFTFTNYKENRDYTTEELSTAGDLNDLRLENVKVYSIVGKSDSSSLNFVKRLLVGLSEDSKVGDLKTSVGIVESFRNKFYTSAVKISPINGYDKVANPLNILSGYSSIASIEGGRDETYGHFLGSEVWNTSNWYHNADTLYPRIRLSVADAGYIYLDAYDASITKVISAMKTNKHIEVRVRGFESQASERVIDIDFRSYVEKNGGFYSAVDAYAGRFVWDSAYTPNGAQPSIYVSQPIWNSTSEGFVVQNVKFVLSKTDNALHKDYDKNTIFDSNESTQFPFQGAIVNKTVTGGRFLSVEIEINHTVYLRASTANVNVGLLAPQMYATDVSGLTIKDTREEGGLSGSPVLDVSASSADQKYNIGLIAGQFIQNSAVKNVSVSNVRLERKGTFGTGTTSSPVINVSGDMADLNVGTFFGSMEKSDNTGVEGASALKAKIQIGAITTVDEEFYVINTINKATNKNVGGIVGNVDGIEIDGVYNLGNAGDKLIKFGIRTDNTASTLNAGLIFGKATTSSCNLNMKGQISGFITGGDNMSGATVNVGGYAGLNSAAITFGLDVDLFVGKNNASQVSRDDILNNYVNKSASTSPANDSTTDKYLQVKIANVGGVVGKNTGALTIKRTAQGDNVIKLNGNYNQFNIQASEAYVGSAVGHNSSNQLDIASDGRILSNSVISIKDSKAGDNQIKVAGGFVGYTSSATKIGVQDIISNNIAALFNGLIFSDCKSATIGGIIGQEGVISSDGRAAGGVILSNTSFGGAIKFVGSNNSNTGNKIVGGSIGQNEGVATLTKNFNFGDVYVLTDIASNYYFGGMVGNVKANIVTKKDAENYSLTTNHKTNASGDYEKAVYGNITEASFTVGSNNYYNHAVAMAIDEAGGKDMGYITPYATDKDKTTGLNIRGYGYDESYKESTKSFAKYILDATTKADANYVSGIFSNMIASSYFKILPGSKLDPINWATGEGSVSGVAYNNGADNTFKNDVEESDAIKSNPAQKDMYPETTNGLRYYVETQSRTINLGDLTVITGPRNLGNIAYIGDGHTLTLNYKSPEDNADDSFNGFIDSITGQSFISGINIIEEFKLERAKEGTFGALVVKMSGGKIYSVGVAGNVEIGGTKVVNTAGFVGHAEGNFLRIENCNSSVSILYRAGFKEKSGSETKHTYANVAGFVASGEKGYIYNSYSTGNVYSFISANLYAFGKGSGACKIYNSYSVSKLKQNDYTAADVTNGSLGAFKSLSTSACWYDYESVEIPKEGNGKYPLDSASTGLLAKSFEATKKDVTFANGKETRNINFNYGYPIHKTLYTAKSSWLSTSGTNNKPTANPDDSTQTSYESSNGRLSDSAKEIEFFTYTRLSALDTLSLGYVAGNTPVFDGILSTVADASRVFFYGVPSFGVLANVVETNKGYNVVLENDIDHTFKEEGTTPFTDFAGKYFDGDDHKISNMTKSLFTKVSNAGASIRNIYFDNTKTINVLAGTITGGEESRVNISNITVQGAINYKGNSGASIGGLIGNATHVDLKAVSNMMNIEGESSHSIGGIVGLLRIGSLNYCSNHGKISGGAKLGGLIGETKMYLRGSCEYTISNSYNAGAIMGTLKGDVWAGGIIGDGRILTKVSPINNSYNAGFIRAESTDGIAYAGGLVGAGDTANTTITNCYNEGSVEAKAPIGYKWKFDVDNVKLIQLGAKNVYADSFGTDCKLGTGNTYNKATTVKRNGRMLSDGETIYEIDTEPMGFDQKYEKKKESIGGKKVGKFTVQVYDYFTYNIKIDNPKEVSVLSYDELGYPSAVRFGGPLTVSYQYHYKKPKLLFDWTVYGYTNINSKFKHYGYWNIDNDIAKKEATIYGKATTRSGTSGDGGTVVQNCLIESKGYAKNITTAINGKNYYLTNESVSDLNQVIVNSGKSFTAQYISGFEYSTTDSTKNLSNASFEIANKAEFPSVLSISGTLNTSASISKNKHVYDIVIVTTKEVEDLTGIKITFKTTSTQKLDISGLKYIYNPDDSSTKVLLDYDETNKDQIDAFEDKISEEVLKNLVRFNATKATNNDGNYNYDEGTKTFTKAAGNNGNYNISEIFGNTEIYLAIVGGEEVYLTYNFSEHSFTYYKNNYFGQLSSGIISEYKVGETSDFLLNKTANLSIQDLMEKQVQFYVNFNKDVNVELTSVHSSSSKNINLSTNEKVDGTLIGKDAISGNFGNVNGEGVNFTTDLNISDLNTTGQLNLDSSIEGEYEIGGILKAIIDANGLLSVDFIGDYETSPSGVKSKTVTAKGKTFNLELEGQTLRLQHTGTETLTDFTQMQEYFTGIKEAFSVWVASIETTKKVVTTETNEAGEEVEIIEWVSNSPILSLGDTANSQNINLSAKNDTSPLPTTGSEKGVFVYEANGTWLAQSEKGVWTLNDTNPLIINGNTFTGSLSNGVITYGLDGISTKDEANAFIAEFGKFKVYNQLVDEEPVLSTGYTYNIGALSENKTNNVASYTMHYKYKLIDDALQIFNYELFDSDNNKNVKATINKTTFDSNYKKTVGGIALYLGSYSFDPDGKKFSREEDYFDNLKINISEIKQYVSYDYKYTEKSSQTESATESAKDVFEKVELNFENQQLKSFVFNYQTFVNKYSFDVSTLDSTAINETFKFNFSMGRKVTDPTTTIIEEKDDDGNPTGDKVTEQSVLIYEKQFEINKANVDAFKQSTENAVVADRSIILHFYGLTTTKNEKDEVFDETVSEEKSIFKFKMDVDTITFVDAKGNEYFRILKVGNNFVLQECYRYKSETTDGVTSAKLANTGWETVISTANIDGKDPEGNDIVVMPGKDANTVYDSTEESFDLLALFGPATSITGTDHEKIIKALQSLIGDNDQYCYEYNLSANKVDIYTNIHEITTTIDSSFKDAFLAAQSGENKITPKVSSVALSYVERGTVLTTDAITTPHGKQIELPAFNDELILSDVTIGNGTAIAEEYKPIIVTVSEKNHLIAKLYQFGSAGEIDVKALSKQEITGLKFKDPNAGQVAALYEGIIFTRNISGTAQGSSVQVNMHGNNYVQKTINDKTSSNDKTSISVFGSITSTITNLNFAAYANGSSIKDDNDALLLKNCTGTLKNVKVYGGISNIPARIKDGNTGYVSGVVGSIEAGNNINIDNITFYGFLHGSDGQDPASAAGETVTTILNGIAYVSSGTLGNCSNQGALVAGNGGRGKNGKNGTNGSVKLITSFGGKRISTTGPTGGARGYAGGNGGSINTISNKHTKNPSTSVSLVGKGGNAGANGSDGHGIDYNFDLAKEQARLNIDDSALYSSFFINYDTMIPTPNKGAGNKDDIRNTLSGGLAGKLDNTQNSSFNGWNGYKGDIGRDGVLAIITSTDRGRWVNWTKGTDYSYIILNKQNSLSYRYNGENRKVIMMISEQDYGTHPHLSLGNDKTFLANHDIMAGYAEAGITQRS